MGEQRERPVDIALKGRDNLAKALFARSKARALDRTNGG